MVGRCLDFGEPPSYSPFVSILRGLTRDGCLANIQDSLPPAASAALSWLLPDSSETATVEPGPRARVFDAVLTLLELLASEVPVVLIIEDVHWADQSTWDLLLFIVANASDTSLSTLVTHRELPSGHAMRGRLAELSRLANVSRCDMTGLRRADVALQFSALAGTPPSGEEIAEVMRLSSGNPLYVEAAVDLLRHQGQLERSQDLLLSPVERLPPSTQAIIRLVAVGGGSIPHRTLLAVSDLDETEVEAAVRPAVDSRLLVTTADGYRFRHELLATLVHDQLLLPGERTRLHGVFAEHIAADPTLAPTEVFHAAREEARHWKEAGAPRRALPPSWRAAVEGRKLLAHPERLRLLHDVLASWRSVPDASDVLGVTRGQVLHDAVEAAEESGKSDLGLELAQDALRELLATQQAALAANVLERSSRLRAQLGVPGAADDLRRALTHLPPGPSALRSQLLAQLSDRLRWAGDHDAASPLATESLEVALESGDDYGRVRAQLAILGLSAMDDLGSARRGIAFACEEAIGLRLPVLSALASFAAAEVEVLAGDRVAAVTAAREGLRATREAGQEASLGARLAAQLTESLVVLGRWDEADEALEHALELDPPPGYRARLLATQGSLHLFRGDVEAAQATLDVLTSLTPGRRGWADLDTDLTVAGFAAAVALEAGHDAEVLAIAAGCRQAWHTETLPPSAWWLLNLAAVAARHSGLPDDSAEISSAQLLREWATHVPALGAEATAWQSTLAAELRSASGAELAQVREQVLLAWRDAGHPYQLGWALVSSAYALLASSKRTLAAERLREAHGIAERLGATQLTRVVEEVAGRAGLNLAPAEQAPQHADDAHGLTPRELEVLHLLTLGRTNRQIGEELFISAKTASIHVSRILAKLNVANRGEAASEGRRLGIVDAPGPGD